MKQFFSLFAACLVTSSAVAASVIGQDVVSANAIRAQVQPASRPVVCASAEFGQTALPLADKGLEAMRFVPSDAAQVEIHPSGKRALAATRKEKLAESYTGRGTWKLTGDTPAATWKTTTRTAGDSVFFQQLVLMGVGQEVSVFGLAQGDGTFVVPRQRVMVDETCDYYFGAFSSSRVALEQFKLTLSNGYLLANANYLGYEAVSRETGESQGFKSLYFACTWSDPAYVPYSDADFTYSVTTLAPSAFADYEPSAWTAYLYYGDSGQFADGDTVTVVNPLLVSAGRNCECYGIYRDGYINIPPQFIGTYAASGTIYGLWIGASDGPEYYSYADNLRLKVSQEGHLLTLDNRYAMILMFKDVTTSSTPVDFDRADYYLSLYEKVNMADALAEIHTNPLEATYYGYGISEYSGAMRWTTSVDCDAATGVLTLGELFPIAGWPGWRVVADYDATTRTLAIKSGQVVGETAENNEPRYAIFAVMNATGDGWLDQLEMKVSADGDFVANDCFIGLAECSEASLDAFLGRFWEVYQPGTAWTEWEVPHAPLASIGTDNLILNHSLNSDFRLSAERNGLMAADAYLYFQNYTAVGSYTSLAWAVPVLTETGESVDTLVSANERMQLQTPAPGWFGYPVMKAANGAGTSADTLNHTDGVTDGIIRAGGSASAWADGEHVPFLMRAAVGTSFVEASNVAPGSAWAKQFNITHAYLYQGIPGNPLYFEGVDIPGCKFASSELTDSIICRIRACRRRYDNTSATTSLTPREILFTAQVAASEAFVETTADGYGYLHFGDFRRILADHDSAVAYLQVNEEFLVELIWPSNETLAFTPLMETGRALAAPYNTFYSSESSGLLYHKLTARNNVWVSLANAMYGYLHVEGSHALTIPAEGGSVEITVYPFDSEEVGGQRTTSIWLAEDSNPVALMWLDEAERDSSWVSAEIVSEDYAAERPNFTLRFTADALPEGFTNRSLPFTLEQRGARLDLEILQGAGAVSAIEQISLAKTPERLYNLYGQPVEGTVRGIVIGRRTKALVR